MFVIVLGTNSNRLFSDPNMFYVFQNPVALFFTTWGKLILTIPNYINTMASILTFKRVSN